MQKRLDRDRTRWTDSVAVSFRTGAAIDVTSAIDWGRDAADMSTEEKDQVLASCERQSDRITDLLIKISR